MTGTITLNFENLNEMACVLEVLTGLRNDGLVEALGKEEGKKLLEELRKEIKEEIRQEQKTALSKAIEGALPAWDAEKVSDGQQDKPKKDSPGKGRPKKEPAEGSGIPEFNEGDTIIGIGRAKRPIDAGKIKALYEAGWNMQEIADEMSCKKSTVKVALERLNVRIRHGKAGGKRTNGKED